MVKKTGKRNTMRNSHIGLEIWLETLKRLENETETLFDLEYGKKTEKLGK